MRVMLTVLSLFMLTLPPAQASIDNGLAETGASDPARVIFAVEIAEGSPDASAAVLFYRLNSEGQFVEPASEKDWLVIPTSAKTGYRLDEIRVEGSNRRYGIQEIEPGRYALNYVRLRELTLLGNAYQAFHEHDPRPSFEIGAGETLVLPLLEIEKYDAEEREGFKGKGRWRVREGAPHDAEIEAFSAAAGGDPLQTRLAVLTPISVECRPKRILLRFKRCEGLAPDPKG